MTRTVRRLCALVGIAFVVVAISSVIAAGCSSVRSDARWRAEVVAAKGARAAATGLPDAFTWQVRAKLPAPYAQACDLVSAPSGLVVAASADALTVDGAALFRVGAGRLDKLLEWDGQGFLRAHAFGSRVFAPDADAPFRVLSYAFTRDVDGYVFVSGPDGTFDEDVREVLPATYHVFDVARLAGGTLVASTGAYPPEEKAYFADAAPAALFVDDGAGRPWRRVLEYPAPDAAGVSRFTWLHALDDGALLASIQTSRPDLPPAVRVEGLPDSPRVTESVGLAGPPIRRASWRGNVYAVAAGYPESTLSSSGDGGRVFVRQPATRPQALAATADALYVLDGGALVRTTDGERWTRVAEAHPALRSLPSALVGPALVVHGGRLWAASPDTGEILEAVPAR